MLTYRQGMNGVLKYIYTKATGRPKLVNLEVTKLCNAKCDFCDYWQTKHEVRLADYSPVIRQINPLVVVITGGEPMLRKDLCDIVRQVKSASIFIFGSMVTKGDLLTVDKARELFNAGLDQIAISLDFPGSRHDEYRGIPGLWDYLSNLIPTLAKEFKKSIIVNTIIMEDNLDQIVPIAEKAREWGIGVSFSSYSVMKTNNTAHFIKQRELERVRDVVGKLIELRRKWKGTIVSTEQYLREIPNYFEKGDGPECLAGINMVQVTPSGHIKRCSEMPVVADYKEYHPKMFDKTQCTSCWYSCRGETQTMIDFKRGLEYIGIWV
ncbi:MAG: radical SAM protein [Deltaproteobacteria bacterium]